MIFMKTTVQLDTEKKDTKKKSFWRRNRLVLLLLLPFLLFVAWLFVLPCSKTRLMAYIPVNATVVTAHENLSARWQKIVSNPVVVMSATSLGAAPESVAKLASNDSLNKLMKLFAARKTVLAYVPFYETTGRPAVILSTEAGPAGLLLGFGLLKTVSSKFESIRLESGTAAWIWEDNGKYLSLTMEDGVLLGCYSDDPAGVGALLQLPRGQSVKWSTAGLDSDGLKYRAVDSGWWLYGFDKILGQPQWMNFQLGYEGTRWMSKITLPRDKERGECLALNKSSLEFLDEVPGDSADIIMALPLHCIGAMGGHINCPRWLKPLLHFATSTGTSDGTFSVSVLSEKFRGRILGIRSPTLITQFQCADETRIEGALQKAVDSINAEFRTGIIRSPVVTNGLDGFIFSGALDGMLADLKLSERPALAATRGWVLLSSNLEGLGAMAKRSNGGAGEKMPRWHKALADGQIGFFYADLTSASRVLREAIALYQISLLAQKSPDPEMAALLTWSREWFSAAGSHGEIIASIESSEEEDLWIIKLNGEQF